MNVNQVLRAAYIIDAAERGVMARAAIDGTVYGPGTVRGITDADGNTWRGDDIRDAFLRVTVSVSDQYWSLRDLIDGDGNAFGAADDTAELARCLRAIDTHRETINTCDDLTDYDETEADLVDAMETVARSIARVRPRG